MPLENHAAINVDNAGAAVIASQDGSWLAPVRNSIGNVSCNLQVGKGVDPLRAFPLPSLSGVGGTAYSIAVEPGATDEEWIVYTYDAVGLADLNFTLALQKRTGP